MAFTSRQSIRHGQQISIGNQYAIISDASTNNLHDGPGKLGHVIVHDVGVTATIVIHDAAVADTPDATSLVWGWVSANGIGVFALQCPIQRGIEITTTGGTPAKFTVVYDT